jgi:S-formylglutathione hydrolase FrmB
MPATIVVFIDASGGPFPDSECADSFDGREWFDTFVGTTVVAWVDSHYRTIATLDARAIMGMSQGGYCAAILSLHHPNVFGTAIAFSGYFVVGGGGGASAAPFGQELALQYAYSPMTVVEKLSPALLHQLYFILVAQPDQAGYGPNAATFAQKVKANGGGAEIIAATEPHGWPQVRDYFPAAVEAWAAHEVKTGVF